MESGQCRCRGHMTGRQCAQVESGYFFMALDYFLYEAELAKMGQASPLLFLTVLNVQLFCRCHIYKKNKSKLCPNVSLNVQSCTLETREHQPGRPATWTGIGFARVLEGGVLEFHIDNIPYSTEYDLLIRYESQVCVCRLCRSEGLLTQTC